MRTSRACELAGWTEAQHSQAIHRGFIPYEPPRAGALTVSHAFALRLWTEVRPAAPDNAAAAEIARDIVEHLHVPLEALAVSRFVGARVKLVIEGPAEIAHVRVFVGNLDALAPWLERVRRFEARGAGGPIIGRAASRPFIVAELGPVAQHIVARATPEELAGVDVPRDREEGSE